MATLYRRGKAKIYYAKWIDESGEPRWMSLKTRIKAEAEKRARGIEHAAFMGKLGVTDSKPAGNDSTPEYAWERYTASVIKESITMDLEAICWSQFIEHAAPATVGGIKATHAAAWQKHLAAKNKPVTVNTKMRNVRVVLNHMIRLGIFSGPNPFVGIPAVKVPKNNLKFRPWEEVVWLVNQASAHSRDLHLVFILGLLAGLRKKEILLQRWEYIDWDRGVFNVHGTKTKSSTGAVPLHDDLRACLELYREDEGWIVRPDKDAGEYRYRYDFRTPWATICAKAGVTASPHMLRHSVATHLLDKGYTMAQVAVFLRHGDIRSTAVYANLKGVGLAIAGNI